MPGAYLATNLITEDATITAATEDEDYPVENIFDKLAAKQYRTESLTALALEFDMGAAIQADTFALINHNFSQAATITLKCGTASPPADVSISLTWREFDIWKAFAAQTKRYWSITVADANTENLAVGQIMLGNRIALPRARRIAKYKPTRQRSIIGGETYAGVPWNFYLFERWVLNPAFRTATAAERLIFETMDRALYGNVYPFLYIPDLSAAECYYVRKDAEMPMDEIARVGGGELVHEIELTLIEESRGLNILA